MSLCLALLLTHLAAGISADAFADAVPQQTAPLVARSTEPAVPVQRDTLRYTVQHGDVFIVNLPDSVDGLPATSYALAPAPALSWLVGRSFFWETLRPDRGRHVLAFAALRGGEPADTLFVVVTVE